MFDSFLKSKFYTKCKYCLKTTKARVDAIRKKKNAVQKYLKNDIAELLRSGLDYNAYGRAEGLLVERNIISCYNLIDEFCGIISNQISVMNKQRECPEECKEAIASLIYAAARFADLPELRDLRNLFTERYGNSFEAFTNKEIVEKSRAVPISKEMKLELIQEIAKDSAIEWSSKALEQQLYIPPQNEAKISPASKKEADCNADRTNKSKVASDPLHERRPNRHRRRDSSGDDSIFDSSSEDNATETSTKGSSTDQDVPKAVSEDEADKPFYHRFIPPPYLKPKPEKKEPILEEPPKVHVENDEVSKPHNPVPDEKPKPRSVRRRILRPPPGRENIDSIGSLTRNDGAERATLSRIKDKDPKEDDEKMLDGLLMHYSKKKPSFESNKSKGNLKYTRNQEKDDDFVPPARATSFPTEPGSPNEPFKKHTRSNSLQQDMTGHVHPKLPDYDQLAARFAALKGT